VLSRDSININFIALGLTWTGFIALGLTWTGFIALGFIALGLTWTGLIALGLTWTGFEPTFHRTRHQHDYHNTTDAIY